MTEKKTFKLGNELTLDYNTDSWDVDEWGWEVGGKIFPDSRYEVEVTFTKKQPKHEVGGTCKWSECGGTLNCIILGVNGSWVWISEDPEDDGWIVDVNDLTDVKPWQPV